MGVFVSLGSTLHVDLIIIFQFSDRICWRVGEIYIGSRFHYFQSGAHLGSKLSQNQDHLLESENPHARLLLDDRYE